MLESSRFLEARDCNGAVSMPLGQWLLLRASLKHVPIPCAGWSGRGCGTQEGSSLTQ